MSPNDNIYETALEADIRKLSCEVMNPELAAYDLGLSVFPLYAWMLPEGLPSWKAERMVGDAADHSRQALTALVYVLQPNVLLELRKALKDIVAWRKRLRRMQSAINSREEYLLAERRAKGRWAEYKWLVERALRPSHCLPSCRGLDLRPFRDFGLRLGEYCFQLQTRVPSGALPDFGPVRRVVRNMSPDVADAMRRTLRVIERKVAGARPTCEPSLLEVFDGFIRRCEQNSPPGATTPAEEYRAMVTLDIALSTALKHIDPPKPSPSTPNWDRNAGILSLDGVEVRTINTGRAGAIVPILDRFQAEQWPPSIPSEIEDDNIRADAVRSLNAKQNRIRFHARGENITWEITNPSP